MLRQTSSSLQRDYGISSRLGKHLLLPGWYNNKTAMGARGYLQLGLVASFFLVQKQP